MFLRSTSRTEGYSLALLEAAAAGLPTVATDVGGNREIVHDGISGMVVPHGEPQAFATALGRLLSDASIREQYSRAAIDWAQKNASVEAMADNYAALYASVGMGGKT